MSLHIQYHSTQPLTFLTCCKCNCAFRHAPYARILQGPICGHCCIKYKLDMPPEVPVVRKSTVVESFVTKPKPKHTC